MKMIPVLTATVLAALTASALAGSTHTLSQSEEDLFGLIKNDPRQGRTAMKLDPILCKVARARAKDLANRAYFDHVNPDGEGPNFLVEKAGFLLPSFYASEKSANNIESIAAISPRGSARTGFEIWLDSPLHKRHILAEIDFNREQRFVGVGIFHSSTAPFETYYVFISAPRNRDRTPPLVTLEDADGNVLATTR